MTTTLTDRIIFSHRGKKGSPSLGEIGTIVYDLPSGLSVTINGKVCAGDTFYKLFNYGVSQLFRDPYAGATNAAEAIAAFNAKVTAAQAGLLSVRANAASHADEETLAAREVVRKGIRTNPAKVKEYAALKTADERIAWLDAIIAKQTGKAFAAAVAAEMARRAAEREAAAKLARDAGEAITF